MSLLHQRCVARLLERRVLRVLMLKRDSQGGLERFLKYSLSLIKNAQTTTNP